MNKIIKTNEMLGYSACLEFPFTGESIIIFDEKLEYEEAILFFYFQSTFITMFFFFEKYHYYLNLCNRK